MSVEVWLLIRNQGPKPIPFPDWPSLLPAPDDWRSRLYADGEEVEYQARLGPARRHDKSLRKLRPPMMPGHGTSFDIIVGRIREETRELELVFPGEVIGHKGEIRVKVPVPERSPLAEKD
jgi:hypothetical protein